MGFFRSSRSKSAKNPQSGCANSFSSSSAGNTNEDNTSGGTGNDYNSDSNVPTVNLTEQRLQDWKAGGILVGKFNNNGNPNPYATPSSSSQQHQGGIGAPSNGLMSNVPTQQQQQPRTISSSSPNQLILLIERGQWNAATQRATTHEHEVKQLVKLRKTTKNSPPSTSTTAAASASDNKTSPSNKRNNVQISNVKCKALHHACQKLRSVHTTIYHKNTIPSSNVETTISSSFDGSNNTTRRIIDEDEYIQACKTILTLIRIHPEACKERESRHGCLPLHLCVFSMCATPPPPITSSATGGGVVDGGKTKNKNNHNRTMSSGGGANVATSSSTSSKRPPINSSRSTSAPLLNLPTSSPHLNKKGHHHKVPSNGSADFSLGNISQMIMEESEHQQALTAHQENSKAASADGSEEIATGGIEERIYKGMESMERLLIGLESRYEMKEDKKKRDDMKKKKRGKSSSGGNGTTTTTTTTTTVVNAMTPMDCLEERSRETDSHTPSNGSSGNGGVGGCGQQQQQDERTGAESQHAPLSLPASPSSYKKTSDEYSKMSGTTANVNNLSNKNNSNDASLANSPALVSSSSQQHQPTYEELQRRYLQINTRRREEYSVRVINALLDAWPKSIKTSSEGGRLPLHMACFGKATVKPMETLLKAYPDAARQRNHDGFLPIHIAAHWGVSHPDIAPLILRAYPDGAVGRNRWERTPIEEALGMAGENGRVHQLSLVWSLRRHPTYWIHNDIGTMLLPRNVRVAPWRMVDDNSNNLNNTEGSATSTGGERMMLGGGVGGGGGAVDVDEVGSSDEDDEGVEVQMARSSATPSNHDPAFIRALAESTDLSLLITKDKHWKAAALRCRTHPHEACEAMEVKVRGAYTAKITPLHYACENKPSVEIIRTLIDANPSALERRQEPGGQLPLHAACTWGADADVIQTLIEANQKCCEMKDFLSNLPLHCACYSGAETVVISTLLRVYPQSVWPRNHQGSSAIDIVRRLGHANRREVLRLLERTQARVLERAMVAGEGVEVENDNSLEWV